MIARGHEHGHDWRKRLSLAVGLIALAVGLSLATTQVGADGYDCGSVISPDAEDVVAEDECDAAIGERRGLAIAAGGLGVLVLVVGVAKRDSLAVEGDGQPSS